jgi:hypothetical protein
MSGCIVCGESAFENLNRYTTGGVQVTLCLKCHRRLLEQAPVRPPLIWTPPDDLELMARAMLEEADLLSVMAQTRWLFAHMLLERVRKEAPEQSADQT